MNFKNLISLCSFLFVLLIGNAQKSATYTNDYKEFNRAIALHNESLYLASQTVFKSIKSNFDTNTEVRANCEYYIADSAIKLAQPNADNLMLAFVENYPTSTKQNNAFLETANYYFKTGKFAYALKWFGKVDTFSLANFEEEEFNFKYGYSLFATKNQEKSKAYFGKVLDSKKYGSQAKYYYGYIAYSDEDYDTANEYLGQVVSDDAYKNKVSYYLADMNFKSGDFEKAIELGEPLIEKTRKEEHSQLSKIIGESYFNLEKYKEATPHLKNYKGTRGKWNNTDYYMLGYAFYKQNNFDEAITYFSKIINGDNPISQNAYYHLAQCYLNQNKKMEALNAFRISSKMEYDLKLQQDAYLNYAKLSYEVGNPYKEVAVVLQDYLKKYPETEVTPEIEGYIISAYFNSQNYEGAVNYLDKTKTEVYKKFNQKATFFLGVQQFKNAEYDKAILNFEESLEQPNDQEIYARSSYWNGEAHFRLSHFNRALKYFNQFYNNSTAKGTIEFENINYHLAYTLFNQKSYKESANYFQKFIDQNPTDKLKLNDSYSRLADTYFVSSDYKNAINTYERIIKNNAPDADYAQFQKAISLGFLKQDAEKIKSLNTFIKKYPKSTFQDDAYFVLADEYVDINENVKAIEKYDQLISKFKFSPFVSRAMLKKSVLYYNTDQNEKALNTYKKVVSTYPNSPEAKQAVSSARQIYVDLGRVDEYAAWAKNISFITVTDADLDNDTYESAERQYLQSNHKKAAVGFEKYFKNFPEGLHALKAHFYLGESLHAEKESFESIPHYLYVIEQTTSEFTERSLYKLAITYLEIEDWTHGLPILERLENEANDPQNILFSRSNLMKGYYIKENYSKADTYADLILKQPKIDNEVKSDAEIIIARSAFKTGNDQKARNAYKTVEEIASGKLKAEALYFDAYFENKDGSYRVSNGIIQKITSDYSTYKYWGAKSLIVMAKNHYELNDAFQSTYILESVIKRFSQFEDVVEEATKELEIIKNKESKTNDSVKPGN